MNLILTGRMVKEAEKEDDEERKDEERAMELIEEGSVGPAPWIRALMGAMAGGGLGAATGGTLLSRGPRTPAPPSPEATLAGLLAGGAAGAYGGYKLLPDNFWEYRRREPKA